MAPPDRRAPRPPGWGQCRTAISEDGAQDSWALRPPQDTRMNSLLGCMAGSHPACELSQDTATWPHHGSHWCGCRRAPLFLVSVPGAMASLPPTGAQARSWLCPRPSCRRHAPSQAGVGHVSSPGQASRRAGRAAATSRAAHTVHSWLRALNCPRGLPVQSAVSVTWFSPSRAAVPCDRHQG